MRHPTISNALSETPIGQALLAFWSDLPIWVLANVALATSLLPTFTMWLLGSIPLAILTSFPAAFVVAGLSNSLTRSVQDRPLHGRDLLHGPYWVTLSFWLALVAVLLSFGADTAGLVFGVQCVLTLVILMLTPFGVCLAALYPTGVRLTWRNAFVVAVHAPMVALGLLAWAVLLGWLVIASKGALFLVVPALWLCTVMFSTHTVISTMS